MIIIERDRPVFKGNTHVHTTNSDGRKSLEECVETYQKLGHDFLVVTDHWKLGEEAMAGSMLVMRGAEYDFRVPKQALHIVGILPGNADPRILRTDDPNDAIARINRAGGAAILAHPAWSMNTLEMMMNLGDVCGAEVFNAVSGMPWGNDRAYSATQLDICANHGRLFHFFTGDDTHYYEGECGMGVNMVQADSLDSRAIISAMRRGNTYCTQGPIVKYAAYDPEERVYTVECSPASRIAFYSNTPWAPKRCLSGSGMTSGEYHLTDAEDYIRCEVIDENGKRAWISPVMA